MTQAEVGPAFNEDGYYYLNGKIAGRRGPIVFYDDAMVIFKAGFAKMVGRSFGALGSAIGGAIDGAISSSAAEKGAEYVIPFTGMKEIRLSKSLINGAGISVVLADGSSIRIAPPSMSMGGLKKVSPRLSALVLAANPQVVTD